MASAKSDQGATHNALDTRPRAPHPDFFPFYAIPGISNFRDVGGWPIDSASASPKHVRKGLLYRGSDTNRITLEGISNLRKLGIRTDFDLRSKQQIENAGGYRVIDGIDRVWAPVFGEEDYTEAAAKNRYELYASDSTDGIVTAFIEILIAGAPMFRIVLNHLMSHSSSHSPPQPLFMHCTTGNNRTGVFISLLLLLLRVPDAIIIHEYTLSDAGLAPTRHVNINRLLKKGAFENYGEIEARRKCERMVGARAESMESLLQEVQRRWGGAEGYFVEVVGLTEHEAESVRGVFTVEESVETDVNRGTRGI